MCAFCPCIFQNFRDYLDHIDEYGQDSYTHNIKRHDELRRRDNERINNNPFVTWQIERIILSHKDRLLK